MTLENPPKRHDFIGTGSLTNFPYQVKIRDKTHIKLIHTDAAVPAVVTNPVVDVDYTVNGVGDANGGSVTFPIGGSAYSNLLSTEKLAILYVFPDEQTTDIPNTGRVFNKAIEDQFDYNTMLHVQKSEKFDRAMTLSESTDAASVSVELPNPVADNILAWNGAATAVVNTPVSSLATQLVSGDYKVDTFVDGVDYTAGATTQLTLANNPGSENNTQIYFDGVYLEKTEYTVAGFIITFGVAIPGGTNSVEVVTAGATEINVPADNSVTTSKLATESVTTAKIADGNTITKAKIDADLITNYDSAVITASDELWFSDVSDGNTMKKDTVQGVVDLIPSSGWVDIEEQDAANDASLSFQAAAAFDGTYQLLRLLALDVVSATDSNALIGQVYVSAVLQTGNDYNSSIIVSTSAAGTVSNVSSISGSTSFMYLSYNTSGSAAGEGLTSIVEFNNPDSTARWKKFLVRSAAFNDAGLIAVGNGSAGYLAVSAYDGLLVKMNSGTIASGKFILQGKAV